MLRTTLKGILAHRLRFVTTALAVTLGVAFMAGTMVLTDTIGRTFDNLFDGVYRGVDAQVRMKAAFNGPQGTGQQRGRVDASVVDVVKRVPGVKIAEGGTLGYARLVGKDGDALGNPAMGAPTLGGEWSQTKALNPFTMFEGRPPAADDEVVIDRKSARDGNLTVGDTTTVLVQGPPLKVKITGIVKFGSADSPGGASVVLFTPAAAQRLVGEPGKYDAISVVNDNGVSQDEIVARIRPVLPAGVEVLTGKAIIKETQDQFKKAMSFFGTFLVVFALVALLVGALMIFNTFSITVAQRTRENGLLRALGASRRQVLASVLIEALAIGLVASVLGLAAGVLVAGGLKALLAGLGMDIPAGGVVFATRTIVISLATGMIVTLLAALSPARKAAKIPPIAAMHEGIVSSSGYGSKQRVVVGIIVLALGVGSLFIGLFGSVDNALAVVGLGALLVFGGVSVLGRTVSLPLSRLIGAPLPRIRGVSGALARENAMRNPKRTASSASALMIGVGLVCFITILASSTKASINATIDRAFTGDYIIDSGGGMMGGLDPSLAQRLSRLPQVASASGIRIGSAKVFDKVVQLVGAPRSAFDIMDVKPRQGSPDALGKDTIAVFKDVAKEKHLKIGDKVPVVFKDTGSKQLTVALIYGENRPAGPYLLGIDAYAANFTQKLDFQIYVKKAAGVSTADAITAVKGVAKEYGGAKVLDQAGFKAAQAQPVNQLLALVYVLLFLAIIIALLGIANTLALSIFERTRELGLLRAVGMTRSQLRSSIRWESVIIALQGTMLGLVIGIFFGWALVTALSDQGIDQFNVPVVSLVAVVVLAGFAGVVAAMPPSRRAAKLDVLRAIVTE